MLSGIRYRVVGRVTMGMEEDGQLYFWEEFNLADDRGNNATLVFEELEYRCTWKLFTMFEPRFPMSVQEAATKRVGQTVNLDGTPLPVTLVDESRVYNIEGEAPEGVEVGDVANYFNAERLGKMIVVSWTGDEVEFFRGTNLAAGAVKNAFGLGQESPDNLNLTASSSDNSSFRWLPKVIGLALFFFFVVLRPLACDIQRTTSAPKKPTLAVSSLAVNQSGKLDGITFRVHGHTVAEVAQVGVRFDRHEYILSDENENKALLIFGLTPNSKTWFLFTPCQPSEPMTQFQAAVLRTGIHVNLDGVSATVTTLFQSKGFQVQSNQLLGIKTEAVFYGFVAEAGGNIFMARWNQNEIEFYRGKKCAEKDVPASFK